MLPLAAYFTRGSDQVHEPRYVAINTNYFDKGAERVAFRCRLSNSRSTSGFILNEMVAKEAKDLERLEEKWKFHEGFAETQDLANYLAIQFNDYIKSMPSYSRGKTPMLRFTSCSVLRLVDPESSAGYKDVLVEKKFDTSRFRWTKWNDNCGAVDGKRNHMPIDIEFELRRLQIQHRHWKGESKIT